ncbi:MAG TPA: GNAT family N-acetyltransferase, partial [Candidatus Limnocylindrales bacterium]
MNEAAEIDGRSIRLRRLRTPDLTADEVEVIRALVWAAFPEGEEGFTEDDWDHALGGMHFVLDVDGSIVAHGSVVERELHVGQVPLRAGYVEAMATAVEWQGRGLGSRVLEEINAHIREGFEIGALGTGVHPFYERLGWRTWG